MFATPRRPAGRAGGRGRAWSIGRMGRATARNVRHHRRLAVRRALLAVAALSAASLLIAAMGSQPPTVARVPAVPVTDPAFAETRQAHLGAPGAGGSRARRLL